MFEKRIHFKNSSTNRYVPQHAARGISCYLGQALVLLCLLVCSITFAEEGVGDVVTTRRETELRKEPYVDSESLGILPAKSLVTLTGEEKGKFVGVEVELEEGAISGWIDSSVIRKKEVREEEALSGETEDSETPKIIQTQKGKKRKKKMIPVPRMRVFCFVEILVLVMEHLGELITTL